MNRFVIARTPSMRPTLMHALHENDFSKTLCGLDTGQWSRAFANKPIQQILCKKCNAALPIPPRRNARGYQMPASHGRTPFAVGA